MRNIVWTGALVLALAVPADADIITAGTWRQNQVVDNNGTPYWDNLSWDCATCNIGFWLNAGHPATPLEYLDNAAFTIEGDVFDFSYLGGITAWTGGVFGRQGDRFTYDSGTGRQSNTIESPGQYALFRWVQPEFTRYFLGIEDILLNEISNDRDYNDYIVAFSVKTESVPEPATLGLFGLGLLGFVRLRRR